MAPRTTILNPYGLDALLLQVITYTSMMTAADAHMLYTVVLYYITLFWLFHIFWSFIAGEKLQLLKPSRIFKMKGVM